MTEENINTTAPETSESFEELLEKSFKTLNTGDKVTGIVTAIGTTEIQVDVGCKQAGYIPVSELSSDPDVKPEDVVKVGDEIEAYVVRVNDVEATPPSPRSVSTLSSSGKTLRPPLRTRPFSKAP